MKKKLSIVLTITLALILSLSAVAFAAGGQVAEKEVDVAQEAGQAWLDRIAALTGEPSEWIGAHLTAPQVYYDLKGQPNAYMFAMEKDGKVVGYVFVGSSSYGYPVFQAGEAALPSIPSAAKVKSILERDLGLKVEKIGEPTRLLYLGFGHLFAIYKVDQQEVAVNQIFDFATPALNLKAAMPSPQDYKAAKKATREAKPALLGGSGYNSLLMYYYCGSGRCWCGPASGVSIGWYYRTAHAPNYYGNLPSPRWNMYDWLSYYMGAPGPVPPGAYGPAFVDMTQTFGYDNFNYDRDWVVTHGDYWNRVDDIDNHWPIALECLHFYYPGAPTLAHWIAIRGYQYPRGEIQHAILCTDSYRGKNDLWVDWDHMGLVPFTVTIKD